MAKKHALCPLCGKLHSVKKDQWLDDKWTRHAVLQPFLGQTRFMAWNGYETWFWCDSQIGRCYITKYYDDEYRYICYTTSWLDTESYK